MILTVGNLKGGVAKTTTSGALIQAAARDGKRTLAVDLDSQSNLTFWIAPGGTNGKGSYDFIMNRDRSAVFHAGDNVDLLAGDARLSAIVTKGGTMRRLKEALDSIRGIYDFIIIDNAPAISETLYESLYSSDFVLIPVEAEYNSLQSVFQFLDIVKHIQKMNPRLQVAGVVVTRYDGRGKINGYYLDEIRRAAARRNLPFLGTIRQGVAVKEAVALHRDLFEYAPKSRPARDYLDLFETLKQIDEDTKQERKGKK